MLHSSTPQPLWQARFPCLALFSSRPDMPILLVWVNFGQKMRNCVLVWPIMWHLGHLAVGCGQISLESLLATFWLTGWKHTCMAFLITLGVLRLLPCPLSHTGSAADRKMTLPPPHWIVHRIFYQYQLFCFYCGRPLSSFSIYSNLALRFTSSNSFWRRCFSRQLVFVWAGPTVVLGECGKI